MNLEKCLDMNMNTEDDRSMKIFEETHCGDEDMHRDDIYLDSDDAKMKIFIML